MSDWTSGYVADIGYTFGYYQELNPLSLKLAFLNAGLVCPEFGTACELGFGQGLSVNLHAAASVTSWHGTDFNPAQAGFAQELASISSASAHLYDEAFDEFCNRKDLPDFDYIGLHGIWSWISDENRSVIVEFIRKKLKVGGVVYISYNTLPGWGSFAPMRHLMTEHAEVIGADGAGIVNRINGALEFSEKLLATNPLFARANPLVADRVTKMKDHSRHYLAHEYFNRDWHPMHFASMAKWMSQAKLSYACSATYLDHVEFLNHTDEQQSFLNEIQDPMFKQTVRDFMVNQQFRKDYWVKGVRKMSALDQAESLRTHRVVLTTPHSDIAMKVKGNIGEANLNESVYTPIIRALSDNKPHTLQQLEKDVIGQGVTFIQLMQALMVLSGMGNLNSAQSDAIVLKAKKSTDSINKHLLLRARSSNDVSYLASPVTGGGIPVGRFQQLFLLSINQGYKKPEEWAQFVWNIVDAQGQKLLKNGQPIESSEENLSAILEQANVFAQKQLPMLRELMVV
jgi:hypothetical protein